MNTTPGCFKMLISGIINKKSLYDILILMFSFLIEVKFIVK